MFERAICARVRAIREQRGLTQAQAAEELGLKEQRYRTYEGRSVMPLFYLVRLLTIVNVPIGEFVAVDGVSPLITGLKPRFHAAITSESKRPV